MKSSFEQVKKLTLQGCFYALVASGVVAGLQLTFFRQYLSFSGGLLIGGIAASLNLALLAYAFMGLIFNGEGAQRAALCSLLSLVFLSVCGYGAYMIGTAALLGFAFGLASPAILGLTKTARLA